jgi:hypothetical protein
MIGGRWTKGHGTLYLRVEGQSVERRVRRGENEVQTMESIGLSGNQRIHAGFPEENSGGCGREGMRVLSEIGLGKGLSVEVYEDR